MRVGEFNKDQWEEEAKKRAWRAAAEGGEHQVYFRAPDVSTAYWDEDSWVKWVNWNLPANRKALEAALEAIIQDKNER